MQTKERIYVENGPQIHVFFHFGALEEMYTKAKHSSLLYRLLEIWSGIMYTHGARDSSLYSDPTPQERLLVRARHSAVAMPR
jgi:hypothetical protein